MSKKNECTKKLEEWGLTRNLNFDCSHTTGVKPFTVDFCQKVELARTKLAQNNITSVFIENTLNENPCSVYWIENTKTKEWIAFTILSLRYPKYFQSDPLPYPEKLCSFLLDNSKGDPIVFLDVWCSQKGLGLGLPILYYSLQKCPLLSFASLFAVEFTDQRPLRIFRKATINIESLQHLSVPNPDSKIVTPYNVTCL
jgi:hypothetical protein